MMQKDWRKTMINQNNKKVLNLDEEGLTDSLMNPDNEKSSNQDNQEQIKVQTIREGYINTEVGVIPEDWEVKELGTVLTFGSGKDYKHLKNGEIPVYGTGGIMTHVDDFLYDGESVGIGRKGTIDKPVFLNGKFWTVDTLFYTYQFIASNPKFIYYKFNLIKWKDFNEASGVPSLNKNTLEKIKISIPNLTEQTAIATALSDTDALINSLEKLIAKKCNIKQGAMQKCLNPDFNDLNDGHDSTKSSNQDNHKNQGSDKWEVKKLGEIAEVRDGTHQTPTYVESGIPFYSVESVTNNDFKNTKYITEEAHKLLTKTIKIEKGDILMTRIGSIGDCKLVDWDVNASFYVSLALLKIKAGYSAEYVYHFSKTTYFKKEADINSLQSAIPKKINLGPISNIKIQMPEYNEQMRIATILSDMDAEIQALETKLEKYRKIKLGMMQNLLTGKIRLV